jgi:hypothetical protein
MFSCKTIFLLSPLKKATDPSSSCDCNELSLIYLISRCTNYNYFMFQVRVSARWADKRTEDSFASSWQMWSVAASVLYSTILLHALLLRNWILPTFLYLTITNGSQNKDIIRKIKRLTFVVKVGCLFCELRIESLSITK